MQDLHYKYVNHIRRKDGSLRPWEEYNNIITYENSADLSSCKYTFTEERRWQEWKHKLVDSENEERSRI